MDIDFFYQGKAFRRVRGGDLSEALVQIMMHLDDYDRCPIEYAHEVELGERGEAWIRVEAGIFGDRNPF